MKAFTARVIARLKKVKPATYVRTLALILALANQLLQSYDVLPVANAPLYQHISWVVTTLTVVFAWWNNNSFSEAELKADQLLADLKKQGISPTGTIDNPPPM